ncbi:hypothetical protein RND81_05G237000 [Saponaria officinalis]|uniref:PUM-HD domain-containing protein n=1 Tax=Saponaria officinalis TaxID=3572 RepID=A0AAW1L3F4_SAPOF
MTTESPIRMLETDEQKTWLTPANPAVFSSSFTTPTAQEDDFTKFLKESGVLEEQKQTRMGPTRSGSAPPTVEGSIAALRTFMDQKNPILANSRNEFSDHDSEERMRTDPAYIAYYYANVNLNPRLPPPLISQENRHLVRLIRGVGVQKVSVADGLLATHTEEPEDDVSPRQSFVDQKQGFVADQGDVPQSSERENHHDKDTVSTADQNSKERDAPSSSTNVPRDVHNNASVSCTNFPTTDTPRAKNADLEDDSSTKSINGSDISVVESRMKSLDTSAGLTTEDNQRRLENLHFHEQNLRFQAMASQNHMIPQGMYPLNYGIERLTTIHQKFPTMQPFPHNPGSVQPLYATAAAYMNSANPVHPGLPPPGFGLHPPHLSGYLQHETHPFQINTYPTMSYFKAPTENLAAEVHPHRSQIIYPVKSYVQNAFVLRPVQGRYFQPSIQETQGAVAGTSQHKDANSPASGNLSMPSLLNGGRSGVSYYGYPPSSYYGYPAPQFPVPSPTVPLSPINKAEMPAVLSGWKGQRGSVSSDDFKRNSFLELLKSNSSKKLELFDIFGQIVEFSTDQHGSRFIQQKLEHCSTDEKDSVFKEVLPFGLKLMTDVFGNYVVQKFFEYGTLEHRRRLGEQLKGHVLSLSLQMYGCRVIQKALEVIELNQKVELVQELDGHVMRCVHDQNGNHVIQKCIESVPTDKIGFILSSFHGQVSALSSHPYGCRVIQRVLEHCSDEKISRCIVDEIQKSTCTLAQDPYGNYVTQHILETGKPHERSQIIQKLAGKFIQMSQLKYASNVVEKCLKYGDASERDLIIEEFIAESDNNDALLILMKDQFANYVVQKIFDIGTEKQKETFFNCIKTHLTVLKRFTYAKQIVARYEQLTEGSAQDQA